MILPEQTGDGKNGKWVKQDFVIETDEKFPKLAYFTAFGDKSDQVKKLEKGEKITVSFNVESREFNGKWYTNLTVWKIEKEQGKTAGYAKPEIPKFTEDDIPPPEEEDLPF